MKLDIREELSGIISEENLIINEMMSRHTTFKTGGPADYFVRVNTEDELSHLLSLLDGKGLTFARDFYIVGNGSNLLVSDEGFRGVIISLSGDFSKVSIDGNIVNAGSAALNSMVASSAKDKSLTGFEFAHGIPGTIGGAVVMNAGAYDGEMKQVIKSVRAMNPDGSIEEYDNESCAFSYRNSIFKKKKQIILSAKIELLPGNKAEIEEKMKDLMGRRRDKQPLEYPSAGSTFKRPEGYFAGKLIEDAGLRGYSHGDAQVSEKHCGFIINKGQASSKDIYELITYVQDKVKENSGVDLVPEVIMLGEF
ncbi:MAG: UDP-N-acetylmuramate dehydrogenase [Butyrivibrio sp.]|nr:UDP-N-acetylmuramate dehydrogenase [Butyrivibrio sp.]